MEEVDNIILHSLSQIGCDFDEDITSLKQFDTDMIVKAAVSCLKLIQPGLELPHLLPPNMATRYKIGYEIAQACVNNGYPGDIGFQTFLYSNETDLRKVLMFLIEKLPKEQEQFAHEPTETELFLRKIKCKVKDEVSRPWLPIIFNRKIPSQSHLSVTNINDSPQAAWKDFCFNSLSADFLEQKYLLPTIITLHQRGVLKKTEPHWGEASLNKAINNEKLTLEMKLSKDTIHGKLKPPIAPRPKFKVATESSIDDQKEKEEQILKEEEMLTKEVEELAQSVDQLKYKKSQIIDEVVKGEATLSQLKEKDKLRAKILELIGDGENNAMKLQKQVDSASQRLLSLASAWEKHRVPLIEQYRKNVQLESSRMSESMKKAETVKSLSEKKKELEIDLKNKEQILVQLQKEVEKNAKEVNRSAFTRRIMEIINNIEKQKVEIDKVLKDTREIQKEINTLSGQLERSFIVAEETIFRDAKKDETSRKAYKLLATLHSDCDELVAMVRDTGAILRKIRDLEDQVEKEKSKNIAANLERITADLNQMKAESDQISRQLQLKEQNS